MKLRKVVFRGGLTLEGQKTYKHIVLDTVDSRTKKMKPVPGMVGVSMDLDVKTRIVTIRGLNPGHAKANRDDQIEVPLESVAWFVRTPQSILADQARESIGKK